MQQSDLVLGCIKCGIVHGRTSAAEDIIVGESSVRWWDVG